MDRDWHTRSHTLSQPQQRPRILRGRPAATSIWWWRSEMAGGGGREPRGFPAERRRNAIQPSGCWPLVGPGLWSEAEPLGPPAPAETALPPHFGGLALAGSHQEAPPPSCSSSAIALIVKTWRNVAAMELPGTVLFWGKPNTEVFCVRYWAGWVSCVLGCFFFFFLVILFGFCFCFLIMFTICLNHSVFYKDSTSSPLPSPYPGLRG